MGVMPPILFLLIALVDERGLPNLVVAPIMILYYLSVLPYFFIPFQTHWGFHAAVCISFWSLVGMAVGKVVERRRAH